jgi:hypothetical protein
LRAASELLVVSVQLRQRRKRHLSKQFDAGFDLQLRVYLAGKCAGSKQNASKVQNRYLPVVVDDA